jgi:hypothetical protein
VRPVPDFREAMPITGLTVAQTIALAVERRLAATVPDLPANRDPVWPGFSARAQPQGQGLRRDLVISA